MRQWPGQGRIAASSSSRSCQIAVLKQPFSNLVEVAGGLQCVVAGLRLLPGFGTTVAEPALIAIAAEASEVA